MLRWLVKTVALLNMRTFAPTGSAAWFGALQGASFPASEGGRSVTPESAMTLSAYWACVRLLSQTIATLPLFLYRRDAAGQKTLARDLPLYGLIHDQPNADMTAVEFWEGVVAALCMWGNAYAEIARNLAGEIVALTPIRPDAVMIIRREDGSIAYRVTDGGRERVLAEGTVFHVKGFGVDGMVGLSPVAYAREALGVALSAQTAAGKTYAAGLRPGGMLTTDQVFKADQRERLRAVVGEFAGPENAGKTMLLEAGLKYQPMQLSPADARLIEQMGWSVEEVCRVLAVPPQLIGHTDKASSWASSLENTNLHFLTYGLRPYLTRIEQGIRRQLFRPEQRMQLHAEFSIEGLLRADAAGRAELYRAYAMFSIATPNEMRQLENWPKSDDPNADRLQAQGNMTLLRALGQAPAASPQPAI